MTKTLFAISLTVIGLIEYSNRSRCSGVTQNGILGVCLDFLHRIGTELEYIFVGLAFAGERIRIFPNSIISQISSIS